jgi:UDPglucose 6-dehydrogenase
VFIIRSTVLPGTCKRLIQNCHTEAIVHNPEFLTEATWKEDSEHPDIIVLGGERTNYIEDAESLYKARFRGSVDVFKTDTMTSETIKYAINCFYTTKVVFANQLYDYCQKFNINYETIKEAMYRRKWIGKNHLRIFDKDNKRGAGGKCLLKDTDAFATRSNIELLKLVNKLNKIYAGSN